MFVSITKEKPKCTKTSFNKNNRFFLFSKGKIIKISRVIRGTVCACACIENINTVWVYSTIIKSVRHWRFYLSTRITYQPLLYILSKRGIVRQIPVFRSYRWKKRTPDSLYSYENGHIGRRRTVTIAWRRSHRHWSLRIVAIQRNMFRDFTINLQLLNILRLTVLQHFIHNT